MTPTATVPVRTGVRSFSIDGHRYMVVGNVTYSVATRSREPLVGADAFHGYSEKPVAPFIEITLRDHADLDVQALAAMEGVECQLELANGKLVLLSGAAQVNEIESSTEEGLIPTRWVGAMAEEV